MPVTFPTTYTVNPQNLVQGPTRFWYAPYVASGADAAQNTIVYFGALDKGGVELDHKLTFTDIESDQFTTAIDTFLTKQEFDIKATFLEVSAANLNILLGMKAASLAVGGGVNTQSLGDPFDVATASSVPTMRPTYFQLLIQYPAPGHDNSTNPAGAWGYIQLFKAFVQAHGALKYQKDGKTSIQVTFRALADMTVAGASKVGKQISS